MNFRCRLLTGVATSVQSRFHQQHTVCNAPNCFLIISCRKSSNDSGIHAAQHRCREPILREIKQLHYRYYKAFQINNKVTCILDLPQCLYPEQLSTSSFSAYSQQEQVGVSSSVALMPVEGTLERIPGYCQPCWIRKSCSYDEKLSIFITYNIQQRRKEFALTRLEGRSIGDRYRIVDNAYYSISGTFPNFYIPREMQHTIGTIIFFFG